MKNKVKHEEKIMTIINNDYFEVVKKEIIIHIRAIFFNDFQIFKVKLSETRRTIPFWYEMKPKNSRILIFVILRAKAIDTYSWKNNGSLLRIFY